MQGGGILTVNCLDQRRNSMVEWNVLTDRKPQGFLLTCILVIGLLWLDTWKKGERKQQNQRNITEDPPILSLFYLSNQKNQQGGPNPNTLHRKHRI